MTTGRHVDNDDDGIADAAQHEAALLEHDDTGHPFCEDRADPSSWDDPAIAVAWADPPEDLDTLDAEAWTLEEPPEDHDPQGRQVTVARRATGVYLNDLPEVIRAANLTVVVDPGYRGRNHGPMTAVTAVVCHHTGSSGAGAWTVVRDGRSDLAGPLAQCTIERDGTVRVLSNGQAWHAGTGSWPSIGRNNANSQAIGIECVYNGADITDAQRRTYVLLVAALVRGYRIPVGNVIAHREWAPTRKTDPGKVDMVVLRRDVQAAVTGGAPAPSPAAPTPVRRKVLLDMPERPFPAGDSGGRIVCPTGSASLVVGQAFFSASVDGGCRIQVWAQRSGGGNVATGAADNSKAYRDWTLRRGDRAWFELPSGTEFVTYQIDKATGPGGVAVEQIPK